ncbi:MAG: hypothetical protein AAFV51_02620 [Pseudomonadota bacterium]
MTSFRPAACAVVHIGVEKTGTTSVQAFLAANRARLAAAGVLYPECLGRETHIGLPAYAQADERRDDARRYFGIEPGADAVEDLRARLETELAHEVEAVSPRTILLSSEHLHSRLHTVEEKRRLRAFLEPFAERIEILCYLRRQDELALSLYSTALRFQKADAASPLPKPGPKTPYYYDYDRMLGEYAEAFGEDAVTVRIYERAALEGDDIISDFRAAAGLGDDLDLKPVPRRNVSLSAPAQRFLASLNRLTEPGEDQKRVRGNAVQLLETFFAGRGRTVTRAEAEAFLMRFAEINERVRSRWTPDRETLFTTDMGAYPETISAEGEAEALADVGARLFAQKQKELRRTSVKLKLREAEIAELRGRKDVAQRRLAEARALADDIPELLEEIDAFGA